MTDIELEFTGAQLGDSRLTRRLLKVAASMSARPDVPSPAAFETPAELEGYYRLVENPYFEAGAILAPHIEKTIERAAKHPLVLAVHDTTKMTFAGKHKNLGRVDTPRHDGFLAHVTLAVSADCSRKPLGVLACHPWVRSDVTPTSLRKSGMTQAQARKLPSEKERWVRQAQEVGEAVDGRTSVLHLMDSEADDYELFSHLQGHRFIVRMCKDRKLALGKDGSEPTRTWSFMQSQEIVATREVDISGRPSAGTKEKRNLPRQARTAKLVIRAGTVTLQRPELCDATSPKTHRLNAVYVQEVDVPEGVQPIDWMLITTEPVHTPAEVLAVIDFYRARWTIEEFFRALKTGCAYESRQMETFEALTKVLAISLPIAWRLLTMRNAARDEGAHAEESFEDVELTILASKTKMPVKTAGQAYLALARLGGHIKNNGQPGWLVLWRGYRELQLLKQGYLLATGRFERLTDTADVSRKTCDRW